MLLSTPDVGNFFEAWDTEKTRSHNLDVICKFSECLSSYEFRTSAERIVLLRAPKRLLPSTGGMLAGKIAMVLEEAYYYCALTTEAAWLEI